MSFTSVQIVSPPTATRLGGVKEGTGIDIASDGTISVTGGGGGGTVTAITAGIGIGAPAASNTITTTGTLNLLPPTGSNIGGVRQGTGVTIAVDGTVNLAPPTGDNIGGVKAGTNITIAADGTISAAGGGGGSGTVTSITAGTGLGAPATGNSITASGTINLLPPAGSDIGGVKAGTNITIATDGTISATGGGTGTVTSITAGTGLGAPNTGNSITATGTINLLPPTGGNIGGVRAGTNITIAADGTISATGGGGGSPARSTASVTTGTLTQNSAEDVTITGFKTYSLLSMQVSAAAWVVLYCDTASRTADASRTQTTDPLPGSGVIAEVITNAAGTVLMSPGIVGWNNDGTPTTNIYAKVTNLATTAQAVTVTLNLLKMED